MKKEYTLKKKSGPVTTEHYKLQTRKEISLPSEKAPLKSISSNPKTDVKGFCRNIISLLCSWKWVLRVYSSGMGRFVCWKAIGIVNLKLWHTVPINKLLG